MRIPQYEQQVNAPSAPQFNQIADVRNDNLGQVADSLNEVYKVKLKEQEEAQKTAFFQADTSIKMALDKAKFDIAERIKNGGSYANAEAEYQKAHDAAIAQFASAFDADKSGNTKLRALAEYQANGLNNLMSIRDMATSRRKSDTAASANLRAEQLTQQMLDASPEQAEEIKKQIASLYASATAAVGGSPDEGRLKAMKTIQGAEQDRFELFRQNNAANPELQLSEIERLHKEKLVDTDFYIQARGYAMKEIADNANVADVQTLISSPFSYSGKEIKQNDVDRYFQTESVKYIDNPAMYEQSIVESSIATGYVPTQVKKQAASMFSFPAENMKEADAQTVASMANVISKIDENSYRMKDGQLPEEIRAKANIIKSSIDSGMTAQDAVMTMQRITKDKNTMELYKSASGEAAKIALGKKLDGELFTIDPETPKYAMSDWMKSYAVHRSFGASTSTAAEQADKDVGKKFGEFNGYKVRDPVTNYDGRFSEKSWIKAAESGVESANVKPPIGAKIAVIADNITKQEMQKNAHPKDMNNISYSIQWVYDDNSPPVQAYGNDGNPLRIRPKVGMEDKKENKYFLNSLGISG